MSTVLSYHYHTVSDRIDIAYTSHTHTYAVTPLNQHI